LTSRGKNQTLPSQQVLTPLTTHNALTSGPPAAQGARRRSHYLEETRHNDIHESSLRDHSCLYHTHAQSKHSKCTLLLVTIGWIVVIVIVVLRQIFRALRSQSDKELGDSLCMSTFKGISIPIGMYIVLISRGFLPCPNAY